MNFNPALAWAKVKNVLFVTGVVPSFKNSVPLVLMFVILKCVTSAPSPALRLMTRPELLCVSSFVVALVTLGVSATEVTVIVAGTTAPPKLASAAAVAAWMLNVAVPKKLLDGVNFKPALATANVIYELLEIDVVPLLWNSVPPVRPVILKWVTSEPSPGLRLMTRPLVVCVSSMVEAFVMLGVSATGVIVIVRDEVLLRLPLSSATWKLTVRLVAGLSLVFWYMMLRKASWY